MAGYFDQFMQQCNREQLVHFAICELDIYELMDLVSADVKTEMPIHVEAGLIAKAISNWSVFQTDITNKILERIESVSNAQLMQALCQLPLNRQNAIMEDDYEWQLKE